MKDNKQKTIAVRVTEEDYDILNEIAFMTGQSVSSFIRQLCKVSINALKVTKLESINPDSIKGLLNENKEAY